MSSNELKNLLVEYVRLFPRNRVARIGHDRPFVIFHMSSPDAHEGRRCKQIGVRGNDEGRCGNGRDLREGVWRAEGLSRGFRLASMFVDLGPAFGTVRVSASIRWPDFPVNRRKFSYARNLNASYKIGDLLVCHLPGTGPDHEASEPLRTPRGVVQSSKPASGDAKQMKLVELEIIRERIKIASNTPWLRSRCGVGHTSAPASAVESNDAVSGLRKARDLARPNGASAGVRVEQH